jgi:hypothetical protein
MYSSYFSSSCPCCFPCFLQSLNHNGAELEVQIELAFKCIKGGGYCHNLLVIWGFGSPESLCLEPVVLALGRGHEGLVGDGCELTIEVILMLMADVRLKLWQGATR